MRSVLFLIAVAVATWFIAGGPAPGVRMKPLTADPNLPTFQESVRQSRRSEQAFADAARNGEIAEDPAMRARRQAVIAAGQKVDVNPCDMQAREELTQAVRAFLKANMSASDKKPTETMVVDGRVVDARGHLNRKAGEVMDMAFADGTIDRRALPFPLNMMAEKEAPHLKGQLDRCPTIAKAR
jgi:hypothetical protein